MRRTVLCCALCALGSRIACAHCAQLGFLGLTKKLTWDLETLLLKELAPLSASSGQPRREKMTCSMKGSSKNR